MTKKSRLDLHLLTKGLVKTRQEAQNLIRAGKVKTINGQILDKPGQEVLKDLEIEVTQPLRYVSRGGEKLAEAFNQFPLNIKDRICLDAGISTGGFTDCLLQFGAAKVYGVDVGYRIITVFHFYVVLALCLARRNVEYFEAGARNLLHHVASIVFPVHGGDRLCPESSGEVLTTCSQRLNYWITIRKLRFPFFAILVAYCCAFRCADSFVLTVLLQTDR